MNFVKGRKLAMEEARYIFGEVVTPLAYMHSLDIAHRDIKLDNVLIFQTGEGGLRFKVADLGFAEWTV